MNNLTIHVPAIWQNDLDIHDATVVTLYLLPNGNLRLRPITVHITKLKQEASLLGLNALAILRLTADSQSTDNAFTRGTKRTLCS
jgi:hypothetical protein